MTEEGKKKVVAKPKPSKKSPSKVVKSIQMDLFSQFLTNDVSEVSNTVEYWERIPKYFISTQEQEKLRTADGLAKPYEHEYKLKDKEGRELSYKVDIQPALIKGENGKYKAFFPTRTEESIEEVLKKIFTEQNHGIHDPKNIESWVKFSYGMIRRELYRMGNGLRYDQIKHGLEVMSKCILTVYEDGKEIYTGAILQDYCSVDREKYLKDTDALHITRLPIFISHAVNTLQYRQFNYLRFMECKEQLTRFLYKRLVNRFIHANFMNDYHFMYSDIQQASGLLRQKSERENRRKVLSALEELKGKKVILSYQTDDRKEGRMIIDVKYTITAHPEFIAEQKAANKRSSMQKIEAQKSGVVVDK
jgi:hypothetical protein